MKLADVSVRRPVFAVMMSLALIVLGWFSYGELGLDLMPRTDSPTVNVRAGLPGASAEEVETTITRPIEAAVNTINGIDELRCSSNQGNGNCTITFVLERDIEAATQDVRDKVATVRFPRDTAGNHCQPGRRLCRGFRGAYEPAQRFARHGHHVRRYRQRGECGAVR